MRVLAIAAAICSLAVVASPRASAQMPMRAQVVGAPVVFGDDTQGYGHSLLDAIMKGRVERWEKAGTPVRIGVAQFILANGSPQPSFLVRLESSETCDTRFGCEIIVVMWSGKAWSPILSTKAVNVAVGPYGTTGMASLIMDGERWDWNGTRYDVGG